MKTLIIYTLALFGAFSILIIGIASCKEAFAESTHIELTPTNHVLLQGEVNNESISGVFEHIYKSDSTKTFYIVIDSPGGNVIDGLRLARYLQTTKRPITCIATTAVSMAFVILQSCSTRLVLDSTITMTHEISAGSEKESLADTKNRVKIEQGLEDILNRIIIKRLKLSMTEYLSKLKPEYWIIGGEDLLKDNIADAIVSISCSLELEKLQEEVVVMGPFGPKTINRNACPF